MNSLGQRLDVPIIGEGNDPGVAGKLPVQAVKMAAVSGQHGSTQRCSVREHVRVRDALICPASVERGQDIVPKGTEFLHQRKWYIFVRVEKGHGR